MTELARRSVSGVALPRQAEREVLVARGDGVVAAERVSSAAYVTHSALQQVALLTEIEAQLIRYQPLGELRYQAIVDGFVGVACAEIARLGLRHGY
jgi:hypothetical protein